MLNILKKYRYSNVFVFDTPDTASIVCQKYCRKVFNSLLRLLRKKYIHNFLFTCYETSYQNMINITPKKSVIFLNFRPCRKPVVIDDLYGEADDQNDSRLIENSPIS